MYIYKCGWNIGPFVKLHLWTGFSCGTVCSRFKTLKETCSFSNNTNTSATEVYSQTRLLMLRSIDPPPLLVDIQWSAPSLQEAKQEKQWDDTNAKDVELIGNNLLCFLSLYLHLFWRLWCRTAPQGVPLILKKTLLILMFACQNKKSLKYDRQTTAGKTKVGDWLKQKYAANSLLLLLVVFGV